MTLNAVGELAAQGAWWEPIVGILGAAVILIGICWPLGEINIWRQRRDKCDLGEIKIWPKDNGDKLVVSISVLVAVTWFMWLMF